MKTKTRLQKKARAPLARMRDSLGRIIPYAREKGIRMGFENRDSLRELPFDEDFPRLFEAIGEEDVVGYWHDSGHARRKELYGLLHHHDHLAANASRMLGLHLKDVSAEGQDDLPVGTGVVDWAMLRRFITDDHFITLELGPQVDPEEIVASHERLCDLLAVPPFDR